MATSPRNGLTRAQSNWVSISVTHEILEYIYLMGPRQDAISGDGAQHWFARQVARRLSGLHLRSHAAEDELALHVVRCLYELAEVREAIDWCFHTDTPPPTIEVEYVMTTRTYEVHLLLPELSTREFVLRHPSIAAVLGDAAEPGQSPVPAQDAPPAPPALPKFPETRRMRVRGEVAPASSNQGTQTAPRRVRMRGAPREHEVDTPATTIGEKIRGAAKAVCKRFQLTE